MTAFVGLPLSDDRGRGRGKILKIFWKNKQTYWNPLGSLQGFYDPCPVIYCIIISFVAIIINRAKKIKHAVPKILLFKWKIHI